MNVKQLDCFKSIFIFFRFLGMLAGKNSSKYYKYYSIICVLIFLVLHDVLVTVNFFFMPRKLDLFIEELLFYFTEIAVLSKSLTFLFMREKIQDILEMVECDIFQPDVSDNLKIVENTKSFIRKCYKILLVVCYTSHLTHISIPLIAHLLLPVDLKLPTCSYSFLSESVKHMLVYPIYVYQSFAMHYLVMTHLNFDGFFWGLMSLMIAQLEILDYNLRRTTDYVEAEENSAEKEEAVLEKLHKCLLHFYEIERFCKLIQATFDVTLFIQFGASICIICVILFRFTLPAPMPYYIFLISYMVAMLVQIMMPCWFGTNIMHKSSSLSVAIYNCDWTPRSRNFKRSMILFAERMNRPLVISGLKLFPLLLTTFTKIMNTAYSFYTFLRNMEE